MIATAILATALPLVAMQSLPRFTAQADASEEARMTEPMVVTSCTLTRPEGGALAFTMRQGGRRGYRLPISRAVVQTEGSFDLSGPNAADVIGLSPGYYAAGDAQARVANLIYTVRRLDGGRVAFGRTPSLRLTPVAGGVTAAGERFDALYSEPGANFAHRTIATGTCIRTAEPQLPLDAAETARYLAR